MIRKRVKYLGLAITAALALSAFVSAASASAFVHFQLGSSGLFEALSYPVLIAGQDLNDAKFQPGKNSMGLRLAPTSCDDGQYGTLEEVTEDSASVEPLGFEWYECTSTSQGGREFYDATVETNGCAWRLTVVLWNAGTADLNCPAGQSVIVTTYKDGSVKCTSTFGSQSELAGVSFEIGSGFTTMYITGLTNTTRGKFGLASCGVPDGTHTDGLFQTSFVLQDWANFLD